MGCKYSIDECTCDKIRAECIYDGTHVCGCLIRGSKHCKYIGDDHPCRCNYQGLLFSNKNSCKHKGVHPCMCEFHECISNYHECVCAHINGPDYLGPVRCRHDSHYCVCAYIKPSGPYVCISDSHTCCCEFADKICRHDGNHPCICGCEYFAGGNMCQHEGSHRCICEQGQHHYKRCKAIKTHTCICDKWDDCIVHGLPTYHDVVSPPPKYKSDPSHRESENENVPDSVSC